MDDSNLAIAAQIISPSYINQGRQALYQSRRAIKQLLSERRLPAQGWSDRMIEMLIDECASMDSNNFAQSVGVGEREARVASSLVARRHYGLAHGIGRSGDVVAEQPKAAGSSLLAKLTHLLAKDALAEAGLKDLGPVTVLPLATGMALTMTLLAIRSTRSDTRRYVLWPRIDQQTCAKSIVTAGYELYPIAMRQEGDELVTDVDAIRRAIDTLGMNQVACIVTTTSCFAPRGADDVVSVAKLCRELDVVHVINNAYGVQSHTLCQAITKSWRVGRVDAVVQSTDKNFMVPVGGSIVCASASNPTLVQALNRLYPGRACMAPLLDLLMTLLHWGRDGWERIRREREDLVPYLAQQLEACASRHGERVLSTPHNPISFAMTLDGLETETPTFFGSMLFSRLVSGTRVIAPGVTKTIGGISFMNYGSHADNYNHVYLTAAAALGTTRRHVDEFVRRMDDVFADLDKRRKGDVNAQVM